jgi:DNA (cytosine-5)-methyltransferase 1
VFATDFDKDCCDTYYNYYNHKPIFKDIKEIKNIPDCDILLGGFPCQGFSIANTSRKINDSRNFLYKELVRLLKLKKPKYFIFENVKGILSLGGYSNTTSCKNKHGEVFNIILKDLEQCGYTVHTKLFKLKRYGIPQNRERVIFLGIQQGFENDIIFNWPLESCDIEKTLRDAISDLPIVYDASLQHIGSQHKVKINGYLGNRRLVWNKASPTVLGGGGTGGPVIHNHPSMLRRMTVREYARIQTFPDDFKFFGSVSSMYKQVGNAVPPRFSSILSNLILSFEGFKQHPQRIRTPFLTRAFTSGATPLVNIM